MRTEGDHLASRFEGRADPDAEEATQERAMPIVRFASLPSGRRFPLLGVGRPQDFLACAEDGEHGAARPPARSERKSMAQFAASLGFMQLSLALDPADSGGREAALREIYRQLPISRRLSFEQAMSDTALAICIRNLAEARSGLRRRCRRGSSGRR
jgi:hypothetical protein